MHLKILPYPRGKEFAVTFVDDTDRSTVENTKPVYDYFHSMGMRGTKTVWPMKRKRTSSYSLEREKLISDGDNSGMTLEDPGYLNFVRQLKEKGFEIALHGVAGGNSTRKEVIEGIERFKEIFGKYPKINVFHETNIENLYAGNLKLDIWLFKLLEKVADKSEYQGTREGSPYFWGDIASKNIKYMRLPFHNISEINTLKLNPSMPFHDPKRPYVNYWFTNSDGSNCERYVKLLSRNNIAKLKRENGACLIYTHLSSGFVQNKNSHRRLNPQLKDVTSYLANQKNGWFPTASDLLDRLMLLKKVTLTHSHFDVYIQNDNEKDINDLTIVCNGQSLFDADENRKIETEDGKIIIKNIPAKANIKFKSNKKDNYFVHHNENKSIRFERKKIELYNYFGLVRQRILEKLNNFL